MSQNKDRDPKVTIEMLKQAGEILDNQSVPEDMDRKLACLYGYWDMKGNWYPNSVQGGDNLKDRR